MVKVRESPANTMGRWGDRGWEWTPSPPPALPRDTPQGGSILHHHYNVMLLFHSQTNTHLIFSIGLREINIWL